MGRLAPLGATCSREPASLLTALVGLVGWYAGDAETEIWSGQRRLRSVGVFWVDCFTGGCGRVAVRHGHVRQRCGLSHG